MLLSTLGVPKLPPMTIRRNRLEQWLKSYAQYPARLVVAPAGSGKTSLLLKYCANSDRETYYCALPENCDPEQFGELIAKTLGVDRAPRSYAAMVDAVSGSPAHCREIVIDEVDNGSAQTRAQLVQLIEDVGDNVTLIYAGRARDTIDARRLIARGVAALCDARRIAFDVEEGALLCEACGVEASDLQVRRMIADTDGWAMAVCGTVRTAAAERVTLDRAFASWRAQSQSFLNDFLRAELQRIPEEFRQAFWRLYNAADVPGPAQLRELESHGMFVVDEGSDHLRLYRALAPNASPAPHSETGSTASHVPPLMVQMFRGFFAKVDGREIQWVRKRDQQIVKYLLLKPNGMASREELVSIFWADTDRHLAVQSVRTACSTIRKAFASVVGPANVDRYFRTLPELQLDLSNIVCDVRRFRVHINDGDAEYERSNAQNAAMHYRAAEKLYAGRLLDFDGPEPWIVTQAAELEERYLEALERLSALAMQEGQRTAALEYVRRARAIAPDRPGIVRMGSRLQSAGRASAAGVAPGVPALHSVS